MIIVRVSSVIIYTPGLTWIKVLAGFASPIGVNRLLTYIEINGEGAVVRPWVWIALLFVGPTINSLAIEWYLYTTTKALVRVEAIITQLIFEHALRIRVKVEVEPHGGPSAATVALSQTLIPGQGRSTSASHSQGTPPEGSTTDQHIPNAGKQSAKDKHTKVKSSNLIGMINNLVTADLGNITGARHFLNGGECYPLRIVVVPQ
jgi:hypothetical protein